MSTELAIDALNVAVSIEKDIPSRVTGANRVFIRAVIARAIMDAKTEQMSADIGILLSLVASHERNGATAVNPFIDAYAAAAAIRKGGDVNTARNSEIEA